MLEAVQYQLMGNIGRVNLVKWLESESKSDSRDFSWGVGRWRGSIVQILPYAPPGPSLRMLRTVGYATCAVINIVKLGLTDVATVVMDSFILVVNPRCVFDWQTG